MYSINVVDLDIQYLGSSLDESRHNTEVGRVRTEICSKIERDIVT